MNNQLKADIEKLVSLCDDEHHSDSRSVSDVEREILNFASYLSASDGTIAEEEAEFFQQYLQQSFSPSQLSQYIQDNNTYSSEFESTVPATLRCLVEHENTEFKKDGSLKYSTSLAYIYLLEEFGKEFLICDGKSTENEVADYNTFISMLKKYRDSEYRANASAQNALEDNQETAEAGKTEIGKRGDEIDEYMTQLNQLVGLESVKNDVTALIHLQDIQQIRRERGLKEIPVSNHLVFYGNPGTGKTTVARLLSKIYHAIGILSKGDLIEVDRSGLCGGYVGQTAIKTKEVIDKAKGGVLFIDEAYSLAYSDSGNDYGREAIDTLLKGMEDYRNNLVVIVAGYPDLMQKFINSNPGLRSRFNKYILFEDYKPDELTAIFQVLCKQSEYFVDNDAMNMVEKLLIERYNNRDNNFANGREVRNIFEKIVANQANRLFGKPNLSDDELSTILPCDIMVS